MKRLAPAVLAFAIAAGACAPSKLAYGKVRSALVDAGLSDANAACMATHMTDRLSLGQLSRLKSLQAPKRSLSDYVLTVRRLGDAELLGVTTSAAALCATGFAPEKKS
ncbi:MAG: hypothetical protein B7Y36_01915 [Novosphingobium sp. 28-62-57]|uniref:hypothetical protein n=1 Tax=unclassified Novosphingobium TaxID=2644732 RepID=UPI000BCC1AE7|nr:MULTISPECIES: hypothetical protein [unclassified Novosphingobium]OYW49725.1 MAG: hypothetical protein B7Z34_08695 [Novosphingobium sp. 12-62-10]OYZ12319.1 MAG: hypothetical protein B7Y36_01915 [Novosphingobium sp. 28-62-57]OZA36190.1 MAG: hypothetical protein B7X92_07370 [Novosphingobium sp. 17-62-9]